MPHSASRSPSGNTTPPSPMTSGMAPLSEPTTAVPAAMPSTRTWPNCSTQRDVVRDGRTRISRRRSSLATLPWLNATGEVYTGSHVQMVSQLLEWPAVRSVADDRERRLRLVQLGKRHDEIVYPLFRHQAADVADLNRPRPVGDAACVLVGRCQVVAER